VSTPRIETFITLGEFTFHEPEDDDHGRVSFDYTLAGEDVQADLSTLLVVLGSPLNTSIKAGRAGEWIGSVRLTRVTLRPPDKKRDHVAVIVKGESFDSPECLQALMKMRMQAAELELKIATLVAEPLQPVLPFEQAASEGGAPKGPESITVRTGGGEVTLNREDFPRALHVLKEVKRSRKRKAKEGEEE
jgi:hypothetical protein